MVSSVHVRPIIRRLSEGGLHIQVGSKNKKCLQNVDWKKVFEDPDGDWKMFMLFIGL